jgi:hypothetical protein
MCTYTYIRLYICIQVLIAYRQQAVTETLINTYEIFISNTSKLNNSKTINNKSFPHSPDNLSINDKNNQQKTGNTRDEIKKSKPILNAFKNIFKSNNLPQKPVPPMEDINSNEKSELTVEYDKESIGMNRDDHDLKVCKTQMHFYASFYVYLDMCINFYLKYSSVEYNISL